MTPIELLNQVADDLERHILALDSGRTADNVAAVLQAQLILRQCRHTIVTGARDVAQHPMVLVA
jgi:hypothetical protein